MRAKSSIEQPPDESARHAAFDGRLTAFFNALAEQHVQIVGTGDYKLVFQIDGIGAIELLASEPDDRFSVFAQDIVVEGETGEQRRARHLTLGRIARTILADDDECIDPAGVLRAIEVAS